MGFRKVKFRNGIQESAGCRIFEKGVGMRDEDSPALHTLEEEKAHLKYLNFCFLIRYF